MMIVISGQNNPILQLSHWTDSCFLVWLKHSALHHCIWARLDTCSISCCVFQAAITMAEESQSPNIPEVKHHLAGWRHAILMLLTCLRFASLHFLLINLVGHCVPLEVLYSSVSAPLYPHQFVFSLQFYLLSLAARQSFQDADLPEITSRELDLLIEESDQFFGGVCLSRFCSGYSKGSVYMSAGHFSPAQAPFTLKVMHDGNRTIVNDHHRKKFKLNGQNKTCCCLKAAFRCEQSFCCTSHLSLSHNSEDRELQNHWSTIDTHN